MSFSCSTERNTLVNRAYHNLTAHYNMYWNGNESFLKAVDYIEKNTVNNFYEILPVYNYGTDEQINAIAEDLERAQAKGSKVIQKHSMDFKGKGNVKWIDESYLLIGKVYFYKKEFIPARRTFEYIIEQFPNDESRFEAMLWLAKAHIRNNQFDQAENLLLEFSGLKETQNIPYRYLQEFPLVYAEFYYYQSEFEKYGEYLQKAIELSSDKQLTTRYKFILGQTFLFEEEFDRATKFFKEVIRRNPDYQFVFQAKLNLAKAFKEGLENMEEIKNQLLEMLNAAKNKEYRDQIYFALAELSLKINNNSSAIQLLQLSVNNSKSNPYQRAMSAMQLAGLYFEKEKYQKASFYYDSCIMSMPKNYPEEKTLRPKLEIYLSLSKEHQKIFVQDSLQKIANMSSIERDQFIANQIQEYKKKELEKIKSGNQQIFNLSVSPPSSIIGGSKQDSKWYFYNPSTLSYGYSQFMSKWGRRKLEDNWRLSRKQFISEDFENNQVLAEGNDSAKKSFDRKENPESKTYYLANVPLSQEKLDRSNSIIIESLYTIAILYQEKLGNDEMAYKTFLRLIETYPENKYTLESYYNLYKLSNELNKPDKALFYKTIITQQYASSKFAKIVTDPNYYIKMNARHNEASKFYEEVYKTFKNEHYYLVIDQCEEALARFNDTTLIPKFDYLKSISEGRVGSLENLKENLSRIIDTYPNSEVIPLAKKLLINLGGSIRNKEETMSLTAESEPIKKSIYSFLPNTFHNYILIVKTGVVNLDALKLRISDFNRRSSKSKRFTISSFELDDRHQLVTVSRFDNSQSALQYLKSLINDKYVLSIFKAKEDYIQFIISNKNYLLFYKDKNIDKYLDFYNRHY